MLAHEFGHILDFRNSFNRLTLCVPFLGACEKGAWNDISWNGESSRYDAQFPLRSRIVFYGDGARLDAADAPALYDQLLKTDFVTMYAAVNRYEDFAETFAFYNLAQKGGSYVLRYSAGGAGRAADMAGRLAEPLLQKKMDFIRSFVRDGVRPDALSAASTASVGFDGR